MEKTLDLNEINDTNNMNVVDIKCDKIEDIDAKERQQALDIQRSFIVQAPAGAGKTTLLVNRLLALLAYGVFQPEECLCITFTQKAASEMRERLVSALEEAEEREATTGVKAGTKEAAGAEASTGSGSLELAKKVLERNRVLNWDLLNNPNRLRIQTIDSLCAEISQRMPLHSGLGSGFKITENPKPFYEEAAKNILTSLGEESSWNRSLETLLNHLDNDWELTVRLLAEMLSKRDQWLLSLGSNFFKKPDRRELEKGFQAIIQEAVTLVHSIVHSTLPIESKEEILTLAHFAASQLQDLDPKESKASHIIHCFGWNEIPKAGVEKSLESFSFWQGIAELFLTEENQLRKTLTLRQGFPSPQKGKNKEERDLFKNMKARMQECLLACEKYPTFIAALKKIKACPPAHYTDMQWEVVQSLLTLLPILVAELLLIFQKEGKSDFIEVALSAHRALGDRELPTDIAFKFGYKTRHILVDEFQDTSLSQFLLLEKLTMTWEQGEGNTIFLVGDPMQSIYRFRRADVSLFLRAKHEGINGFPLVPLTLKANFRSGACIIQWVNEKFSKEFPEKEEMDKGAIPYAPFNAQKKYSSVETEVLMHSLQSSEEENKKIIECIENIKKHSPEDSIAILVRSRSHLRTLLPALKQHEIAYQGIELEKLHDRMIIQDLLSLTNALIHLGDRIAWLSLLRSPLCGMALEDLLEIATFNERMPLFCSLQEYQQHMSLSEEAKERLTYCMPILEEAIQNQERYPITLWIRNTWQKLVAFLPLKALYPQSNIEEEVGFFFKILRETALDEDIFTVGLLTQKLAEYYATTTTTTLATKTTTTTLNEPAVQIMTIHKAKGLEFDSVLLPGLGRKEKADETRLLLFEERIFSAKVQLLLAPICSKEMKKDPIYEFLKKEEQCRAQYEKLRLLYVATTRAKKRLYGFLHDYDDNQASS